MPDQADVRRHEAGDRGLLVGAQSQAEFGAAPEYILGGLGPFVALQVADFSGGQIGPKTAPKILKAAGAVHEEIRAPGMGSPPRSDPVVGPGR